MKKIILALCISFLVFEAYSQNQSAVIESVKSLCSQGKYLSAFREFDKVTDLSKDVALLVTNILVEHAVGFNEEFDRWMLEDRTGGQLVRQDQVEMSLSELLWSAWGKFPGDCEVAGAIGSLYAKAFNTRDQYLDLQLLGEIGEALTTRVYSKCHVYTISYAIGYCNTSIGKTQAALTYLQKSLVENPNYAPAYLQMGKAYFQLKDNRNALQQAKKAFDLSKERTEKGKAALLMGQVYGASGDNKNALSSLLIADSIYRKDFFIQKELLEFYVKTGDTRAPQMLNSFLGSQGRGSLHFYLDALEIYKRYGKQTDLAVYSQKALAEYSHRSEVAACFNFTLGMIYEDINAEMSKAYYKKAKELGVEASRYPPTRNHPATAKYIEDAFRRLG